MAIERLTDIAGSAGQSALEADLYTSIRFPDAPGNRPYTIINMVTTVDGKTLVGPVGSTARGLGSPTDQLLMRRIQGCVEGAIVGAGTLRPGNVVYRPEMWRAVVTGSGDFDLNNRFFTDSPERAIVFAPESLPAERHKQIEASARLIVAGDQRVDVADAVRILRSDFGIHSLVVEGGASLNFEMVEKGLVDELFLTVAPKLKGGANLPTAIDGAGLPDWEFVGLTLQSLYRDGDELYYRWRVGPRQRV